MKRLLVGACVSSGALCIFLFFRPTGNAQRKGPPDRSMLRVAYERAERWFIHQIDTTGLFIYEYDSAGARVEETNNSIRQLMASRLLAELAAERADLLELHRTNFMAVLKKWYRSDGVQGYILEEGSSKLGANAMALRTIVASPFRSEYDSIALALVEGILALSESDGRLHPWYVNATSRAGDDEYLMKFYSGEAVLALAEYATFNPDTALVIRIAQIQEFYIEEYVAGLRANYYPAYVPWHTMSIHALQALTGKTLHSDAAFVLNDKLLELQDTNERVGRFYSVETPQYGAPHASSDGVYTEGVVHAYLMAKASGDVRRCLVYADAISRAVLNLISLQHDTARSSPPHLHGAIRSTHWSNQTRIDNTQHTLDALRLVLHHDPSRIRCMTEGNR